jgi:ketosteroid isomerase-like protein
MGSLPVAGAQVSSAPPTPGRKGSRIWLYVALVLTFTALVTAGAGVGMWLLQEQPPTESGWDEEAPRSVFASDTIAGSASSNTDSGLGNVDEADSEAELSRFLADWVKAWESEDMARYSSFYAKDFYSNYKGMDYRRWMAYKVALFRKYTHVQVTIGQPTFQIEGDTATVEFTQLFRADKYQDRGVKTMYLRRETGGWVITGEEARNP